METNTSFINFSLKLKELILTGENIYIIGHSKLDLDALASCLGIYQLVTNWHKKASIIIDENINTMEAGCQKIIYEIPNIKYTTSKNINITSKDILIVSDTNNSNLIDNWQILQKIPTIVVIDHHCISENTIPNTLSYIANQSSASKIVADIKEYYQEQFPKEIMECLIAGIYLDTYNLTNNQTTEDTIATVLKLLHQGSELSKAMQYFIKDYEKEAKFQELEDLTEIYHLKYLISIGTKSYASEAIAAKASQFTLECPDMDGIFVIGKLDNGGCKMSARSNGKLNIGHLMEELGGGGSINQGAVQTDTTPDELKKILLKKLLPPK